MKYENKMTSKGLKIRVDIDDTICKTQGMDYENAKPIYERIQYVNDLFDRGHEIVYWTARGTGRGLDFRELTEAQLTQWGCKYTRLEFKPAYDLFVDDKACRTFDEFKGLSYSLEMKN